MCPPVLSPHTFLFSLVFLFQFNVMAEFSNPSRGTRAGHTGPRVEMFIQHRTELSRKEGSIYPPQTGLHSLAIPKAEFWGEMDGPIIKWSMKGEAQVSSPLRTKLSVTSEIGGKKSERDVWKQEERPFREKTMTYPACRTGMG